MPPHVEANIGRPMLRAWSQQFSHPFHAHFTLEVDELHVSGEWAFERGRYRITLTPNAGGAPIGDVGKYITIYQHQPDESWKLGRDIWNSDHPPAPIAP